MYLIVTLENKNSLESNGVYIMGGQGFSSPKENLNAYITEDELIVAKSLKEPNKVVYSLDSLKKIEEINIKVKRGKNA